MYAILHTYYVPGRRILPYQRIFKCTIHWVLMYVLCH
jgi:hypothetical protein